MTDSVAVFLRGQIDALETLADDAETDGSTQVKARTKVVELQAKLSWHVRHGQVVEPKPRKRPGRAEQRPVAARMIAAGRTTAEVAEHLGAHVSTVNRWRQDPEFDEEVRGLQATANTQLHDYLAGHSIRVAAALAELATAAGTNDMARVHACRVFFELLGRHKNAPVAPVETAGDLEDEDAVLETLRSIPRPLLERALGEVAKPRTRDL